MREPGHGLAPVAQREHALAPTRHEPLDHRPEIALAARQHGGLERGGLTYVAGPRIADEAIAVPKVAESRLHDARISDRRRPPVTVVQGRRQARGRDAHAAGARLLQRTALVEGAQQHVRRPASDYDACGLPFYARGGTEHARALALGKHDPDSPRRGPSAQRRERRRRITGEAKPILAVARPGCQRPALQAGDRDPVARPAERAHRCERLIGVPVQHQDAFGRHGRSSTKAGGGRRGERPGHASRPTARATPTTGTRHRRPAAAQSP